MSQQKIPLFGGLIQACHDSTTPTPAVTPVFTPPDSVLAPGSQAYYAVHLWLKPAVIVLIGAPTDVQYSVQAFRGSNPSDKRLIWSAADSFLLDVIGFFNAGAPSIQQVGNFSDALEAPVSGIPTKILDGYVVRGDVTLQLESKAVLAGTDQFASPDGTKIWGYYYRIGAENEGYRFIGELPAGPLFDTGLPIKVGPGETKVLHAFQPDRIDEIYLEIAALAFAGEGVDPALPATLTFSDSAVAGGGTALSAMNILLPKTVRGAPNTVRDPESPYNIYGAWGNNPALKTLQITNADGATSIFVHGRFARH
jgi:hypothetical protein